MGSCASKKMRVASAAVHPWAPPPAGQQRLTVRMRASEFNALAAGGSVGAGDFGRVILDGCMAGRWTWSSPATSS
ncbi:hypothetical protein E2562_026175 [Oryza meyeriana var. granulata]|uniref:Uncharacterized protein n=1 Tax=Oryza meyeriana var. granulata TaxID=110450 RepID=A0A6G1E2T2_9ORYZ|nr:hypothetical protein E2562_026175 [Oryza meyeriana var. granulata]